MRLVVLDGSRLQWFFYSQKKVWMPNAGKFLSTICCDRMRHVRSYDMGHILRSRSRSPKVRSKLELRLKWSWRVNYKTFKRVLRLINIKTFSVRSTFVLALNLNSEDEKRNESSTKRALSGEDDSRQKKLKVKTWELDHEAPPASAKIHCSAL